ncbi:MAG: hypothetical protein Q7O66_22345, partial [Dehalococcoidia bacterium]|nr:hypothetical protein [Dehalococcoidia bacterium]
MTVSASDSQSGVIGLSFSNDGDDRGDWQSYLTTASWLLAVGDGPKIVYARVRDLARNVSLVSQRCIELNTSAGTESGLAINNRAV